MCGFRVMLGLCLSGFPSLKAETFCDTVNVCKNGHSLSFKKKTA